jgi:hypothetical protein
MVANDLPPRRGWDDRLIAYQGLTPLANHCRPSGAGGSPDKLSDASRVPTFRRVTLASALQLFSGSVVRVRNRDSRRPARFGTVETTALGRKLMWRVETD